MASAGLTTEIEDRDGIRLIHASGPLDSMTHDEFRNLLDSMVGKSRFRIVLDCANLTYVNSTGLTLLAHYQRATASHLSFFGVAALNPRILKAIELLGMGKLVRLYATVEDALRAAKAL
jgi:anti-anti-sigma factor